MRAKAQCPRRPAARAVAQAGRFGRREVARGEAGGSASPGTGAAAGAGAATKAAQAFVQDQREFDALPAKIETLEAEKATLESTAGDPGFLRGSAGRRRATLERLSAIGGEIDAAYERWAELEALRGG